jgi:hypothetical protein
MIERVGLANVSVKGPGGPAVPVRNLGFALRLWQMEQARLADEMGEELSDVCEAVAVFLVKRISARRDAVQTLPSVNPNGRAANSGMHRPTTDGETSGDGYRVGMPVT